MSEYDARYSMVISGEIAQLGQYGAHVTMRTSEWLRLADKIRDSLFGAHTVVSQVDRFVDQEIGV